MSDWMRDRAALHCQNYAFTSEGSIRDLIEECYQRGLAASEARVRELEADVERLRDAVQLEISQRRVDDSYGRDKSACQTVSDILERRGNDFGLMSALAAARKETP